MVGQVSAHRAGARRAARQSGGRQHLAFSTGMRISAASGFDHRKADLVDDDGGFARGATADSKIFSAAAALAIPRAGKCLRSVDLV